MFIKNHWKTMNQWVQKLKTRHKPKCLPNMILTKNGFVLFAFADYTSRFYS